MDRLQAVTHLRQRPADDDGHRVVQERTLDLILELDGLDSTGEQPFLCHLLLPLGGLVSSPPEPTAFRGYSRAPHPRSRGDHARHAERVR